MAYALDDGEDICISTSPIRWTNNAADIDPTAFTAWVPYTAWRIIAGDWTDFMIIGECRECHVEFASNGNSFRSVAMAPLSVDCGRGEGCPD